MNLTMVSWTGGMQLRWFKVVVIVSVLLLPLLATLAPLAVVHRIRTTDTARTNSLYRWLSVANCASAGVFLGACLLDLLPAVERSFDSLLPATGRHGSGFPLAQFCVAVGFFVVLIVESAATALHRDTSGRTRATTEGVLPPSLVEQPAVSSSASSDGESTDGSASCQDDGSAAEAAGLRSVLLVVALSVHSVIEGLAVGLQTTRSLLLQLFVAVLLHKIVLGFSLGVALVRDDVPAASTGHPSTHVPVRPSTGRVLTAALVFCCASPCGVAIGWALSASSGGEAATLPAVNAVLQAAACGTFLYVTLIEVLPRELQRAPVCGARLPRVLAVVLGFSVVCAALFLDARAGGSEGCGR